MKIFKNQRGDTIVEVLISVAILSLILSVSYALANRSSQAVRQAQERSEALKISESQLESLKSFLSSSGNSISSSYFCVSKDAATGSLSAVNFTGTPPTDRDAAGALDNYPAQCQSGTDNRYKVYVNKFGTDTYNATIRWTRVTGQGNDEVSMVYRVYPPGSGSSLDLSQLPSGTGASGSCPTNYELTATGCAPIPPSVSVAVKRVKPLNGNKDTPACTDPKENKSGISVLLDGITQQTQLDSTALFTRKAFNRSYTATITVPPNYQACNGTTSSVTTTNAPNTIFNTAPELVIKPVCWGSALTPVPYQAWDITGYSAPHVSLNPYSYNGSNYIKSYRYGSGGYPLGRGPDSVIMPPGPEGLSGRHVVRIANGSPVANPAGNLYDFYNPVLVSDAYYGWVTKITYTDTRQCPS